MVALVILGSSLGLASFSVPSAFAVETVDFYSNPRSATIIVNGIIQTYGSTGTFTAGERVLATAIAPPGIWEFDGWVVNGVSVESPLSQSTYITIHDGQGGSVTAVFHRIHLDNDRWVPPPSEEEPPQGPD